jgi:hypothetical protein
LTSGFFTSTNLDVKSFLLVLLLITGSGEIGRSDGPPPGPTRITLVNAAKFAGYRFYYGQQAEAVGQQGELTEIRENQSVDLFHDSRLYVKFGEAKPVAWKKVKHKYLPQSFIYRIKAVRGEGEKIRVEFEVEPGKAPPSPPRRGRVGMVLSGLSMAALGVLAVARRRRPE